MLSIPAVTHDMNFYDGNVYRACERYTRIKHCDSSEGALLGNFPLYNKYYQPEFNTNTKPYLLVGSTSGVGRSIKNVLIRCFLEANKCVYVPKNFWDYQYCNDLYYIDHHQGHGSLAYLNSGYKEADTLIIDGQGINYKTMFINKHFEIFDLTNKISIGRVWSRIASFITKQSWSASRLMGLVGYSHLTINDLKYKQLYNIIEELHLLCINDENTINNMIQKYFNNITFSEKADIAFTLQQFTNDLMNKYIKPLRSSSNLCVSGGVAYNGYLNEFMYSIYNSVYVPFAPGDEGQSLGLYMHYNYTQNNKIDLLSPYLGQEYDTSKVRRYKSPKEIAILLSQNKTVALFQGRSEAGHRALGNRSILANPMDKNIKDRINHEIKFREDFRPFAPVVHEDKYQEWFDTPEPSKYMNRIVKSKHPETVPGVTHIDGTSRIQTLEHSDNSFLYEIIDEFYKITGVPMLLNTSFNSQEPIVETPEDAIKTFNKTKLDELIIL